MNDPGKIKKDLRAEDEGGILRLVYGRPAVLE